MIGILKSLFKVQPIESPFTSPRSDRTVPNSLKEKVAIYAGRRFVERESEDGVIEQVLTRGRVPTSSAGVDEYDLQVIGRPSVRESSYVKIKRVWSSGATIADCVMAFKGQRGFKERTIEKYYSLLNESERLRNNTAVR